MIIGIFIMSALLWLLISGYGVPVIPKTLSPATIKTPRTPIQKKPGPGVADPNYRGDDWKLLYASAVLGIPRENFDRASREKKRREKMIKVNLRNENYDHNDRRLKAEASKDEVYVAIDEVSGHWGIFETKTGIKVIRRLFKTPAAARAHIEENTPANRSH